jgi:hypothetical protein
VQPKDIQFDQCILGGSSAREVIVENVGDAPAFLGIAIDNEAPAGQFYGPWMVPSPIPPGRSRDFNVIFAPTMMGSANATVRLRVQGSDTYTEDHEIAVTGAGGAPQMVLDPPVLDLGAVPPGQHAAGTLRIRNDGDMDLVVLHMPLWFGAPNMTFGPGVHFPFTVSPGANALLPLFMTVPIIPGEVVQNESTVISNDPRLQQPYPVFRVLARSSGPRITWTDFVDLRSAPVGVPLSGSITLSNVGSEALIVHTVRLQTNPSSFALTLPPPGPVPPGGSQSIAVTLATWAPAGIHENRVVVTSNDAKAPTVYVRIRGVRL